MGSKIKINVYGNKDAIITGDSCNNKHSSCSGKCEGCKSTNSSKTIQVKTLDLYYNLINFLTINHMKENVDIHFIELAKNSPINEESIKVENLIKKGFKPPITVIDGIIRYYAGISNVLVYRDVLDLIE
ncbi:hypothetical protein [Clostridium sp. AWRP]|uniref:hypothetical protein n=1 Tax=Clostridium sp. AWRP TaxID=2212991 RepID=UPI000FDC6E41|nr:hypothetical protein [Clostridium sp. AWRP]AZV57290.1 hypothetical protein DMR38_12120 [Clostridium sp. AWRP]